MRILLVEDERSAARMIAKGLREHGHAVDLVGDGAAALQPPRLLYIDELVSECVRAVSVIATTRTVGLVTHLQPDVSLIGDDELLRRLTMNLLDNAVQYTPPGGAVTVTLTCDAKLATITFSDTGPGIAAADRERVFERFVRIDPARSENSGAGLGLPIARWIAEEHGGTSTVEQNDAGGCRFVALLPRKQSKISPTTAPGRVSSDQTS